MTVTGKSGEVFCGAVPASNYSTIYSWDDFGDVSESTLTHAFNAFTATSNAALTSVGFYTEAAGASYTITIYDTYSGGTLSNVLGMVSGVETYAGYHTVDLSSAVSLTAGPRP